MGQNKVITKTKEELISTKKELIYKLIDDLSITSDINEFQDVLNRIKDIKKEISFIIDTRDFLVDDKNNIIIDFWEKFDVASVEEYNENGYHLIEVRHSYDSMTLLDINGQTLESNCLEFDFEGNKIIIKKYGHMIGKYEDDEYHNEYWVELGTDDIL